MKKIITNRILGILIMSMMTSVVSAQFVCYNSIDASLDPNGAYVLFPEDLLAEGDLSGLEATVSPEFFTCGDLGDNDVTLEIFEGGNLIFSCISNVNLEDHLSPVAICQNNPVVTLEANGVYTFNYEDIDNGSWDNCSIAAYQISPSQVQCGDLNPLVVTLTVMDEEGNSAICSTEVTWHDYPNPNPNLACNDEVQVFLIEGEELEITSAMILEGGPYACPERYTIEISENMIPRPDPIVTLADTNKILLVTVTDTATNTSCWGNVSVYQDGNCIEPFLVCDTECRSNPLGDCDSGHTADDHIEWPCDIYLDIDCDENMENLTPDYLLENNLAEMEDVYPEIINPECYITGVAYADVVFLLGDNKRIERTWRVIDWQTSNEYEYLQTINVSTPTFTICDTLPWNTPASDCQSGHTFDDGVEWPADITVSTVFVSPEDLAQNPDVASEDVEPQLQDSCGGVLVNYADVYFSLNDTTVLIERTWGVFEVSTGNLWDYVQKITVQNVSGESVVCVTREDGEPISGVTLAPGIVTDASGCYSFANPSGVVITPVKDSPLQEGVNLLDQVLIREGVLAIKVLSIYQNYAADLSQNNVVSTLDIALLDKLLNGTFDPTFDHNWMFYDQITQSQSMDISNPFLPYHFIGVKMGDVDNSFPINGAPVFDPIGLQINDEILNKKEHYQIPFMMTENVRIQGFTISLENPANNLNFTQMLAPELPGFNMDDHVVFSTGVATINYIVPNEFLEQGVALTAGSPLFYLELSPAVNTFLSQELKLRVDQDNLLSSTTNNDGLEFSLDWENLIISSVIGVDGIHTLEFYPNPVANEIRFKGLPSDVSGLLTVIDPLGRIQHESTLYEMADLSALLPGVYYLQIRLQNGQIYTAPLTKM